MRGTAFTDVAPCSLVDRNIWRSEGTYCSHLQRGRPRTGTGFTVSAFFTRLCRIERYLRFPPLSTSSPCRRGIRRIDRCKVYCTYRKRGYYFFHEFINSPHNECKTVILCLCCLQACPDKQRAEIQAALSEPLGVRRTANERGALKMGRFQGTGSLGEIMCLN
jgi:hypothetical protein